MKTKTVKLDTFIENPDNPQTVTPEDFALLVESLRTMPQTLAASKIAYVTDYVALDGTDLQGQRVVIAGNKRLRALKQLAFDHATSADGRVEFDAPLPAEWFFDLTPLGTEARKAWLVKSNIQSGEWDAEKLLALYPQEDLAALMGDETVAELLAAAEKDEPKSGETDADAMPDETPETPVSKRGEVYTLGEHRLMCGDSASAEDAKTLMGGGLADMVFTDPPYGVAIGDKNKALNEIQRSGRVLENIENDAISIEQLRPILTAAFTNLRKCCADDACYYVTAPQGGGIGMMMMMMKDAGLEVRHVLMWRKNTATFSIGRLDYDYAHEPIFYTWTKSHHNFRGGENRTSVWEYDKPRKCDLHPTMKPVALVENAIKDGTLPGMIVADFFGGSGTTLIACEQLGRKARLMEIDPKYCDVIRRRWAEFVHGEGCNWQALTPATND